MKRLITFLAAILITGTLFSQLSNTYKYPIYIGTVGGTNGMITLRGSTSGSFAIGVNATGSATVTGTIALPGTTSIGDVSSTEIGYLNNVTSAIQTQLNAKQATLVSGTNIKTINSTSLLGSGDIAVGTGTVTSVATGLGLSGGTITTTGTLSVDTASASILSRQRAVKEYQGKVASVSSTELGYLDGVTSAIQTQLNNKTQIEYFIAASNASAREKLVADETVDGTADEVQINAALTAGHNVRLSSGQFNIAASITAAVSNVILSGAGKAKTTIYLSNGANARVIVIGGDYWTIEKLKIDGNDAGNTGSLFGIYGIARTGINIYNCEITNIEDDGIAIRDGCSNWVIEDCVIHDLGACIFGWQENPATAGPSNIRISRCHFYDAMVETQVRLTANTVAYAPYNWTIDNCYFSGYTGYKGVLFASAKNCNVVNSYFHITDCPGVYGPGGIRYYTGASGMVSNNVFKGNSVEVWGGSDIIIKGNYFTHPGAPTEPTNGIMINAYDNDYDVSNINVEGNIFYNISVTDINNAIILYAETGLILSRANITGNTFLDDRGASAKCGYAIGSSGTGTVKDVNISNNVMEGMLDYGIVMVGTENDDFLITNNIIIDVPVGINASDGNDIVIRGNKFKTCTTPINFSNAAVTRPLVTENTMYGCTNSGSYATATGELFGNNLWHDGTYDNTIPE